MEFRSSPEWMKWTSGVWNGQSGIAGSGMEMDGVEWDGQSGMGWTGWNGMDGVEWDGRSGMGWTEWNGMDRVEWDGQGGMGWTEWNGMVESGMGMVGWENVGNVGNGLYRNMVYDKSKLNVHLRHDCWSINNREQRKKVKDITSLRS